MKKTLMFLVVGMAVVWSGLAEAQNRGFAAAEPKVEEKTATEAVAPQPAAQEGAAGDPATAKLQALDLRRRVAQLMIVTLRGAPLPTSQDFEFLERYTPGGVLVPPMLRPIDARDYIEKVVSLPLEAKSGIPLLIGTNLYDLPKGRIQPNAFFPQLPSLLSIAAANDTQATEHLGSLVADQLVAMGFNMNLGPSLELAPNLPDAYGTLDCLGSDPKFAATAGGAILKSLTDKGLLAVPMGFPGGGANRLQKAPAVLLTPSALLAERDLLPFQKAIEQGSPVIHVSNTYVPMLDPGKRPASLSSAVMQDLLRGKMKFEGVILAGPMDTNDVSAVEDPALAAVSALRAGADMLLWNEAGSRVMKAVDEIVKAVNAKELSEDVVNNALRRVITMKEKQGLAGRKLPEAVDAEKLERNKNLPEVAYDIERRAITLVQNRNQTLPLNEGKKMAVGVTGEVGVEELHDALAEYLKIVVQQPIRTAKYANRVLDFEIRRITEHVTGIKTAVCVFANSGDPTGKVALMRGLQEKGIRVVVVLLGYPSHLNRFAEADAILVAYCGEVAYGSTMKAMADVLVGQAPVTVLAIEKELKTQVGKKEVFNPLDIVRSPAGALPVTIGANYPAGTFAPYDPTFTLKKCTWDFGDGKKSKDFVADHTYGAPGRYPITMSLLDKKGKTTTRTFYAVVE